jgi:hypothetical protein
MKMWKVADWELTVIKVTACEVDALGFFLTSGLFGEVLESGIFEQPGSGGWLMMRCDAECEM